MQPSYHVTSLFNFLEIQKGNGRQAKRKDGRMNKIERGGLRKQGKDKNME